MSVAAALEKRIRRDGCGCPAYVERSAHYEGQAVWFITPERIKAEAASRGRKPGEPCPTCGHRATRRGRYWLVTGPGTPEEPRCSCTAGMAVPASGCSGRMVADRWVAWAGDYNSESEAEEAFRDALDALLRGEG